MIKYELPLESFIGGWFIDKSICKDLIKFYKKSPNRFKFDGTSYVNYKQGVHKKFKDSKDLYIHQDYIEEPIRNYRIQLQECLNNYIKQYPEVDGFSKFNINQTYNIQHYKPKGGYKIWHSERNTIDSMNRVLVFMTFLNDVPDGGTMFKYQNLTIPAKTGLTLIWPTDFTHTHKGQISKKHEKYIVTGWYSVNDY